jgi:hypothetical protein
MLIKNLLLNSTYPIIVRANIKFAFKQTFILILGLTDPKLTAVCCMFEKTLTCTLETERRFQDHCLSVTPNFRVYSTDPLLPGGLSGGNGCWSFGSSFTTRSSKLGPIADADGFVEHSTDWAIEVIDGKFPAILPKVDASIKLLAVGRISKEALLGAFLTPSGFYHPDETCGYKE